MKEHVQKTGVRKYAGDDLIELQAEPLKAIQRFFEECGMCVIQGCEVTPVGNLYNVALGVVALFGADAEGNDAFKVVPFSGVENVSLPIYLTLTHTVFERAYADQKVKPIAYNYTAVASGVRPAGGGSFLEITTAGGRKFVDAIKVTEKLDKVGNGKDVTVTFSEAPTRENVASGEKLSVLFGKVRKWFAGLAAVAFSGKASDLTQDANNRLVTDTEKAGWNDKYTKSQTDTKDTDTLAAAKSYTDALAGNVYKKTETYTRLEIDDKDAASLQAAKNYAAQKVADVVNNSPAALDTLQELAAALGNDPNFATSIMALIGGKAETIHSHSIAQVANLQSELNGKEPAFGKNTAFNKAFGTTAGTVCQGNDARLSDARTPTTHSHPANQITEDSTHQFISDAEKNIWNNKADSSHNHTATDIAEDTYHRFFTDEERIKLGNVEESANKYIHPDTHSASIITESVNKRFMQDSHRNMLQNVTAGASLWHSKNLPSPVNITSAGIVSASGGKEFNVGVSFRVSKTSSGMYRITHDLGHSNYFVLLNCVDQHGYAFLSNKTASGFDVGTAHDGTLNNKSFFFLMFIF